MMTGTASVGRVGHGHFVYEPVENWGRGPNGHQLGLVSAVATDSADRVYVFNRTPEAAVLIFDRDGTAVGSWGQGYFRAPHSIWIDRDDVLYLTDTLDHTLRMCTSDGQMLRVWGTPGTPGAPGAPFNQPTWAMRGPSGALYVTDGYGQSRVHTFSPTGELLHSWGEPGDGPGQFALPHAIWVDRDERVLVVDRENHRIQIFDREGSYLDEWRGFERPQGIFVDADDIVYIAEARPRISILAITGERLASWGEPGDAPGQFKQFPHAIWADSHGDLYIGEVTGHDLFQKFRRV